MSLQMYDILGVGIGPFNLSLASLLQKTHLKSVFFDKAPKFSWHSELMFEDAIMQTAYMKDLVTPADPTSPYSFLNYLHEHGMFYQFLNTERKVIKRKEFEKYCTWVSNALHESLRFSQEVRAVSHKQNYFEVETEHEIFRSKSVCVATGKVPFIPESCRSLLNSKTFLHAKDRVCSSLDLKGKRVAIIGGGQTGVEFFSNALHKKWGKAKDIRLFTRRKNLEPLDETAFTNEYFTPQYVNEFWKLNSQEKDLIVDGQKLSSDGNTPSYLLNLYKEIYDLSFISESDTHIGIYPMREVVGAEQVGQSYGLNIQNNFNNKHETWVADVVILCTGFKNILPPVLEPLYDRLQLDQEDRLVFNKNYSLKWDGPLENKIYVLNFSRHSHGIADPQTSLMAWRSATIVNDLMDKEFYKISSHPVSFLKYSSQDFESLDNEMGV